jgi:hypothetical protein
MLRRVSRSRAIPFLISLEELILLIDKEEHQQGLSVMVKEERQPEECQVAQVAVECQEAEECLKVYLKICKI